MMSLASVRQTKGNGSSFQCSASCARPSAVWRTSGSNDGFDVATWGLRWRQNRLCGQAYPATATLFAVAEIIDAPESTSVGTRALDEVPLPA